MRTWMKGVGVLAVSAVIGWSCSSIASSGGKPLTLTLTTDRQTAAVGQDVTFTYDATGTSISGILLEYGDGALDSINSYGSQTASGRRVHAYGAAGDYVVVGTIFDAVDGTRSATAAVTVTAAPSAR